MASTNKTTNYDLSQFLGTDKPAWLADYNSDMSKIDAGIKAAQTTATGADGKAESANIAIGTLANLTTTEKTNLVGAINEVDTDAGTAQGTANDAYALASQVQLDLNGFISEFSFTTTQYNSATPNGRTISNNASFSGADGFSVAVSPHGIMFKCYSRQNVNISSTGTVTITLPVTGLPVAAGSDYSISGVGTAVNGDGTKIVEVQPVNLSVSNNQIKITFSGNRTGLWFVYLTPCLYFNADFGDE